uniref:Neuroglian n=1 Tax=Aceria tosichella TaxID=561515 RepID=A0A6G1SAQ6_9ACAR
MFAILKISQIISICAFTLISLITITTAQFLQHGYSANITQPPTMIKQPGFEQLYQVSTGDETDHPFTLDCEAYGSPEPRYWWTKNGARFDYEAYDKRISQKPKLGTLIFGKPEAVDEGLYQCFAENDYGTSMSNAVFLRRSELSSFPEERPREIPVEEGDPISLDCNPPSGYPKPQIFWMFLSGSGALHSINSSRLTVDPEGKLHFSNVTKSDQLDNGAMYACSATSYHRTEYKVGRKTRLSVRSRSTGLVNHHPPEAQYLSPPQVQVLRGQKLVLFCIYGGTPLPEITWRKKGGSLEGNRVSYQNFGKTLVISKVDEQDEGTYECSAINGHGSQLSHAMQVSVSSAPYWIRAPNSTNAAQDESVHFECLAEGDPKPNLEWLINGQPISTQKRPNLRIDGSSLYIDSVKKTDVGVFQCNSSNMHGYAFRDFYLNVLDLPPVVLEPPEKVASAVQASTISLKCRVFGAPKPKIKWRRDNVELSGGRYKVLDNGDLQIEYVMPNDQGTYQCKASNKFAEISREGELHVKMRTTILQKPESIEIPAGRMAVLRCNAESDPSLHQDVHWLYNGKMIDVESDPRIIKSRDNSLTITKTRELDSGNYTCLAKTSLDQDSASATLTVQDVPNPPRITNLDCDKQRATLQWTSTGDRRAPILSYDIHQNTSAKPDVWENAFQDIAAADPRFTLNLQPWLNYTFRVIARNKIGTSLPSEPSQVCTSEEAPPSTNPTDVKGRGTAPNNLVISWTAMDRRLHHAPGFRYKIYWRRDDIPNSEFNTHIINDWKESKFVVTNQPTFVPYRIKVEAQNNRGQSLMAPDEVIGYSGQDLPTQEPKNFRLVKLVSPSKAIFSWDPVSPESIRGRFKGYRISSWPDKEDRVMRSREVMLGNVTTAEVEILKPFSNNTVEIAAVNELFSGPPSNQIVVTTPEGVPEAVPSLIAAPMGTSAFYLVWKRPEKVNGRLIGYEIYYEEVSGTELKERVKRRPSIDDPLETKAKLANLKPNTKYRITIVAKTKVGEGAPYFIEATTNGKTGIIVPDQPSFTWSKLPEKEGSFGIRVTWLPNYRNGRPGTAFQVQFRKLDSNGWQTTPLEEHVDTVKVEGLDPNSAYEVRVMSVDGNLKTSSNIEIVSMDGGYVYRPISDPLSDPTWLIALACAIALLMIIFFLVCFVKQNRGGKYLVHEKEVALGRDTDDPEEGFDEYKGVNSSVTRPLRGEPSLNSLNESDEDSLTDYEGDRSKFEEDGSFIGQYGVKRKHDLPTIQTPGVATFV